MPDTAGVSDARRPVHSVLSYNLSSCQPMTVFGAQMPLDLTLPKVRFPPGLSHPLSGGRAADSGHDRKQPISTQASAKRPKADRAMTRAVFIEYMRQSLVPIPSPGDIVVMDNLQPHKTPGARADRGLRRQAALPAGLLAGCQSNRANLSQTQSKPRSTQSTLSSNASASCSTRSSPPKR